jgi:hypothetical protein
MVNALLNDRAFTNMHILYTKKYTKPSGCGKLIIYPDD